MAIAYITMGRVMGRDLACPIEVAFVRPEGVQGTDRREGYQGPPRADLLYFVEKGPSDATRSRALYSDWVAPHGRHGISGSSSSKRKARPTTPISGRPRSDPGLCSAVQCSAARTCYVDGCMWCVLRSVHVPSYHATVVVPASFLLRGPSSLFRSESLPYLTWYIVVDGSAKKHPSLSRLSRSS